MQGVLAKSKVAPTSDKPDGVSLQKRSNKALGLLRAAGVPKELDWVAAEGIQSYDKYATPSAS